MHTLLFGDTWYGKYGFRPFNGDTNKINKQLNKIYENNKKIVDTVKVKTTKIFLYIYDKNIKIMGEKKANHKFNKMFKECKDMTISQFFQHMYMDYKETCKTFINFYLLFAIECGIRDFSKTEFFLDL